MDEPYFFIHSPMCAQPLDGLGLDRSVGPRTDVEQEIAAISRRTHEVANDLARLLKFMSVMLNPHELIDRERRLERQEPISLVLNPAVFAPGRSCSKVWTSSPGSGA